MDIIAAVLFCIVSAVIIKAVGSTDSVIKVFCTLAAVTVIAGKSVKLISEFADDIRSITDVGGIDGTYIHIIFKCLGISFVTQLGCDCCKECGENALASQLELAGKAAVIVTALPLFSAAVEVIRSLIML